MNRVLTTALAVVLLLGLGALAVLAMPGGNTALNAAPFVSAAPELSPDVWTGPRFNHIALPLNPGTSLSPFTAQGLLDYIGTSALQVANLNATTQALDFWDGTLGFGIVDGIPIYDPAEYPLVVGHAYLVQLDSTHPVDTPFSIVGGVPEIGDVSFTLVGGSPCKYNEIAVPLDQYDQNLTDAALLAGAVGNVDVVAEFNAANQNLDFWDLGLGFGIVNGIPIYDPTEFPVRLGYPYLICVNTSGDSDVWP